MITQEEADDLVQKALMRDRAERITDAEAAEADAMAERRRRVEDMTTAVDTLIKYQKIYNKKEVHAVARPLTADILLL